jgi:hypothetical protein
MAGTLPELGWRTVISSFGRVDLCHRPADRCSGRTFGMLICLMSGYCAAVFLCICMYIADAVSADHRTRP